MDKQMIITPFRYSMVEEGLFRGGYPTRKNFRFLRRLKLKTIISLIPNPPNADLLEFCEKEKITNLHFSVPKFKEDDAKVTLLPHLVSHILSLIIDASSLPVFLHCLDGAHTTGLLIMCLRKLQNWGLTVILSEFTRFTRDSQIHTTESEFLENFKREVFIPVNIPKWLWQGERILKHPIMNIKLIQSEEDFRDQARKRDFSNKKTVHEHWKDPSDDGRNTFSRNLQALALDTISTAPS